ncbi:MAG: hypothetical protein EXQ98_04940 [Alphaproteobacteria bacterium]|nr:hypothetical protein [Alphaproteobacteria bacterium]
MAGFFSDPLVQSVLVPVAVGFLLTGAIRIANGQARGPLVAGASVGLGFLIAYGLTLGVPPLPPSAPEHELPYVVVAGLVIGFLLDFFRRGPLYRETLYLLGSAAALYWIAQARIDAGDAWTYLGLIALWLGALMAGYRLELDRSAGLNPVLKLLVAALGLGAIAILGAAPELGQISFGLATALGGFALWNWPVNRYPFGAALLLGAGGALIALAFVLVLYSETSPIALALLLLCFFADVAAKRVKLPAGKFGDALRPFVLIGLALVPALAAVAVAYIQSTLVDSAPI